MSNKTRRVLLISIMCTALAVIEPRAAEAASFSANPVSSGMEAAVYGGIAAAAGLAVVGVWLVVRKPSVSGCIESRDNALVLMPDSRRQSYALTGNTGQLKVGERLRLSGKRDKTHHTFSVTKLSKDLGSCQTSSHSH